MKKVLSIVAWAILLGLISCTNDNEFSSPKAENRATFKITIPGSPANTKSVPAEEGENAVNDLTLLFFEPTTNGTGKYKGAYTLSDDEITRIADQTEFSLSINFDATSGLSKSEDYSILAMGNMNNNFLTDMETALDNFLNDISTMTLNDVRYYARMQITGVGTDQDDDSQEMNRSNLPMSGETTRNGGDETTELDMVRAVSRFDVVNNASLYTMQSVSIWNANQQGTVWDAGTVTRADTRTRRFYGLKNTGNTLKGGLYAFENISLEPDVNDSRTTCLIIGISGGTLTGTRYFRVNISPDERGQYLKRNNVYQLTVSDVTGSGESNEYDAYSKGKLELDVSINSWDRDEDGLIIRDGDNLLALPTRKAVFGPESEERQYYVYTLGAGTLELNVIDLPPGITARLGGSGNDLFITVESYTLEQRKGSIELRFAGMKGIIEIIQSGQAQKFLTLSHTQVAAYPSTAGSDKVTLNPITVTSSGPWTATIYQDFFSFTYPAASTELHGTTGNVIEHIYTSQANTDVKSRYGFVLVTLDADPDNYRNVIVLTQTGTGGFDMTPDNTEVNFEADMSLSYGANNKNVFTVIPSEDTETWNVSILRELDMDKFTIVPGSGYTGEADGVYSFEGTGSFTINPVDQNNSTNYYTANIQVEHMGVNTKTIKATQYNHNFTLNPTSVSGVASTGGTTQNITVTSSRTDVTWSAEFSGYVQANTHEQPMFLDSQGNLVSSLSGQALGSAFKVVMPGINRHLTVQPTATVTVSFSGTDVTRTLTVTQNSVTYVEIKAQTMYATFGRWSENETQFNKWKAEMISSANFGPSGTVYTSAAITANNRSYTQILSNARIFNINEYYVTSAMWTLLSNSAYNQYYVYVFNDHNNNNQFRYTELAGVYAHGDAGVVAINVDRVIYRGGPNSIEQTQLWQYLFGGEGPFGAVNPDNVRLRPSDVDYGRLTAWPTTFIPLIMNPHSNAANQTPLVGIDPTNRIVWVGDTELFSTMNPNVTWSGDNLNFLRNLIAWCVNVMNYGDAFTNRFKETTGTQNGGTVVYD